MTSFPYPGIIIAGPTACGKSGLALELAKRLFDYQKAVIINADSMQVYQELSIITARPSVEDCAVVPHHLYGVINAQQGGSAGWWKGQAEKIIQDCQSHSIFPILVGGTGLYLRALTQGLSPIPAIDASVQQTANQLLQQYKRNFYDYVCQQDPLVKDRLKPKDYQRLQRALEVFLQTQKSIFTWHNESVPELPSFLFCFINPDRKELYQRIDQRFLEMMDQGALEEIQSLKNQDIPAKSPLLKAIGVQELFKFLEGSWDLKTAIQQAQQNSRRYAKRQITWFRHQIPKKLVIETPNIDTLWSQILSSA